MLIPTCNSYISADIHKDTKRKRTSATIETISNLQKNSFGAAKLNKLDVQPGFLRKTWLNFLKTYNSVLEKEIGHNSSNLINYSGKAIISPLMVFAIAPFTDEKKDAIRNSAILHPVQAFFSFVTAITTSFAAGKVLDHQAKKGTLGNFVDNELGNFFNPAMKNGSKNLSKLKGLFALFLTVLTIPLAGIVLNEILPKIIKKDKDLPTLKPTSKDKFYA